MVEPFSTEFGVCFHGPREHVEKQGCHHTPGPMAAQMAIDFIPDGQNAETNVVTDGDDKQDDDAPEKHGRPHHNSSGALLLLTEMSIST